MTTFILICGFCRRLLKEHLHRGFRLRHHRGCHRSNLLRLNFYRLHDYRRNTCYLNRCLSSYGSVRLMCAWCYLYS